MTRGSVVVLAGFVLAYVAAWTALAIRAQVTRRAERQRRAAVKRGNRRLGQLMAVERAKLRNSVARVTEFPRKSER